MPDLSTRAVGAWLVEQELDAWSELPDATRRAEIDPSVEAAVVALGIALDETDQNDPKRLTELTRTDPPRTIFQSVLSQLGSARLLRLLDWLTEPGKPHRQALLAALLWPESGDASWAIQRAVRYVVRRSLFGRMNADARLSSLVLCVIDSRRARAARRSLL